MDLITEMHSIAMTTTMMEPIPDENTRLPLFLSTFKSQNDKGTFKEFLLISKKLSYLGYLEIRLLAVFVGEQIVKLSAPPTAG